MATLQDKLKQNRGISTTDDNTGSAVPDVSGTDDDDLEDTDSNDDAATVAPSTVQNKYGNAPVSKQEAGTYVQQLAQLAKDPAFNRPNAPSSDALKQALAQAKQMYQEQTTKNDWGQVAEMVGHAVAQAGAARAGLHSNSPWGQDNSNLNFGPGVDWEGRNNRAMQGYRQDVSNAMDIDKLDRDEYAARSGDTKEQYGRNERYLDTALSDARARDRIAAEQARYANQSGRFEARQNMQDKKLELSDLSKQEQDVQKQLQAQQTLSNQMSQESDLGPKASKKLQEKYGPLAATAGIDLNELQDDISKVPQVPGKLWGTNPDPQAASKAIQNRMDVTKSLLDGLHARKQQLLIGSSSAGSSSQQQQQQAPDNAPASNAQQTASAPSKQDANVLKYAAEHTNGSYDAARKILTGRGYKPTDGQ